jgi:hypothetical protein
MVEIFAITSIIQAFSKSGGGASYPKNYHIDLTLIIYKIKE